MIKPGMLIQWKFDNSKWGWIYKEKPTSTYEDNNVFEWFKQKTRISEEQVFEELKYQYALLVVDKLSHQYKVGNVILKNKVYWKCILTKQDGTTQYVWVEDDEVEPYVEGSYEIKNLLLKKHLRRIDNKNE